jgi:hypothetical protein
MPTWPGACVLRDSTKSDVLFGAIGCAFTKLVIGMAGLQAPSISP